MSLFGKGRGCEGAREAPLPSVGDGVEPGHLLPTLALVPLLLVLEPRRRVQCPVLLVEPVPSQVALEVVVGGPSPVWWILSTRLGL